MPDAKTILLFRERLAQARAIEILFNRFDTTLRNTGYLPMPGQILDATLVAASNLLKIQIKSHPKNRQSNRQKPEITRQKHQSTVIHAYQATFKRFLEVCGDKRFRDYTGKDLGLFKSMMEQLPETYGKQRNDTRTIQQFVALAKK